MVETDHRPLAYLKTLAQKSSRVARWALIKNIYIFQRLTKRVRCIQTVMRYQDYNLVGCRQHIAI